MNVIRITTPEAVLAHWDLFREGLETIRKATDEQITESEYCRLLTNLAARTDDAWIGVVVSGGPICYAVAQDSTPPHRAQRTFTVSSFYHRSGESYATQIMMFDFEEWARRNGVTSYIVTTRRDSGSAIKCFQSARYGFRKGFIAFEKQLAHTSHAT